MPDYTAIQSIRNFKALVRYLRTELEWPVDEDQADDLTFDYEPEEVGLDPKHKVKVREIKQIRPLVDGQPWGIFWLEFEPKHLPVMVMRRILGALASRQRARRNVKQARWDVRDLMFISATGQGSERGVSFAHFRETDDGQPQLRTFSWDVGETHLYFIRNLNLAALRWPANPQDAEAWRAKWAAAFTAGHRETIRTAEALAGRMALLADATRHAVNEAYLYEKPNGPLHKLYESFRKVLIHDLSVDDFADMYAQTVTYGLFSARATRSGQFALENVVGLIPNTNPFLRELFAECLKVSQGTRRAQIDLDELGVGELVETLQNTDIEQVLRDWGRQRRGEDPVIHFYETFLRQYDAEKKARRGVFYTPDPVVSFIVRSVDYLLRTEFGCKDGLATPLPSPSGRGSRFASGGEGEFAVQVLDPATGTGTFLKYVIEQIYDTFTEKHKRLSAAERKRLWNEYVPTQLLPRLYGFELMMAPYAVAHMKLGLELKKTEYDFASNERLRVYLTNALQSVDEIPRVDTAFLAHEAEEANTVKTETPITVVIGNPPYSKSSSNQGGWIEGLMENYKTTVREAETQIQALSDDYAKFLRFAQWRVQQTGYGVVAMITNNGYLDGPLFRDMRSALSGQFQKIWILNLHGDSRKKETPPIGVIDKNVFDIQQGVCITLMVSLLGKHTPQVYCADMWGDRETKYEQLLLMDLQHIKWSTLNPKAPHHLFIPVDAGVETEWNTAPHLYEVFGTGNNDKDDHVRYGAGFVTQQDEFAISFERDALIERVAELLDRRTTEDSLRANYSLCTTNQWSFSRARKELPKVDLRAAVRLCAYRPFDFRYTLFDRNVCTILRERIMSQMEEPNLALLATRRVTRLPFNNIFATDKVVEYKIASHDRNTIVFPLYFYASAPENQGELFGSKTRRKPNLSPKFIAEAEARLGLTFTPDGTGDLKKTLGPEDLFHYMYAVFHSPTYRTRYAEFLKIDFPRLPLTRNLELFRTLAAKGKELVSLHLLEAKSLNHPITQFTGKGDNVVAKGYPHYEDETVWINETQGFAGVPEAVWEFHIGGYQVCHKWLKDRRGRELSAEDRAHYAKVVVALKETTRLMAEIDAAIPGWPIE